MYNINKINFLNSLINLRNDLKFVLFFKYEYKICLVIN